ncbi:MAG: endonuclease [Bacteroidota bacterium]
MLTKLKITLALIFFLALQSTSAQQEDLQIINREDFSTLNDEGSWVAYSTQGDDSWQFEREEAAMNGFGGTADEDWLISPLINLTTIETACLSFQYRDRYSGPNLRLVYSTNYMGGNPSSATWLSLTTLPDGSENGLLPLLQQAYISLSTLSGRRVYLAFHYTSAGAGPDEAEDWRIDDIEITAGGNCSATATPDYYTTLDALVAEGVSCLDLKAALHQRIKGHRQIYYSNSDYDAVDFFCAYDMRLNDAGTKHILWDVYSDQPDGAEAYEYDCPDDVSGPVAEGFGFNREHVVPKSWWGGTRGFSQDNDIVNLLPSDAFVNAQKSNFPLGITTNPVWTSTNGTKIGWSDAAHSPQMVFEPINAYKGDFARIFLYMAVRYHVEIASWRPLNERGKLALSGDQLTAYEPCLLRLLLEWHEADPVSDKERARNEGIFTIQGNRNPFVDRPEFAALIWGNWTDIDCGDSFYQPLEYCNCIDFSAAIDEIIPAGCGREAGQFDVLINGNSPFYELMIRADTISYLEPIFADWFPDTIAQNLVRYPVSLPIGRYDISVEDEKGCRATFEVDITHCDTTCTDLSFSIENRMPPTCEDSLNYFECHISGNEDSPAYFLVIEGRDSLLVDTNVIAYRLPAGQYVIKLLDTLGCTFRDTMIVRSPLDCDLVDLDCTLERQIYCGETIVGTTLGANNLFNRASYDCYNGRSDFEGGDQTYLLKLETFTPVLNIRLSDLRKDLDIFLLSSCDSTASCIAESQHSFAFLDEQIVATDLEAGVYFIVVDGANAREASSYTLQIDCMDATTVTSTSNLLPLKPTFEFFPNPANSTITVHIKDLNATEAHLSFRNALGQSLVSYSIGQTDPFYQKIEVSTYSAGVYFLVLQSDEQVRVKTVLIIDGD